MDSNGQKVTDKDVITGPSLVYFGYTFSPHFAILDLARNAKAIDILEERGNIVKPVFISIDPQRDTPEVVADFTDAMHPRMLGLTGSPEQVKAASQAYRTFYKAHEPEEGEEEYYLVDHSTFSYLVLPEKGLVGFFRRDLTAEELSDRVQCILKSHVVDGVESIADDADDAANDATATDETLDAASGATEEAALGDSPLSIQNFNLYAAAQMIDDSDISPMEKVLLKAKLIKAQENPKLLKAALEQARSALGM